MAICQEPTPTAYTAVSCMHNSPLLLIISFCSRYLACAFAQGFRRPLLVPPRGWESDKQKLYHDYLPVDFSIYFVRSSKFGNPFCKIYRQGFVVHHTCGSPPAPVCAPVPWLPTVPNIGVIDSTTGAGWAINSRSESARAAGKRLPALSVKTSWRRVAGAFSATLMDRVIVDGPSGAAVKLPRLTPSTGFKLADVAISSLLPNKVRVALLPCGTACGGMSRI